MKQPDTVVNGFIGEVFCYCWVSRQSNALSCNRSHPLNNSRHGVKFYVIIRVT
jgi:hypothetical protein